jgi:hypothetical protein
MVVSAGSGLLEIGYFCRFFLIYQNPKAKDSFLKHKHGATEGMDQNIFSTETKR